MSTVSVRRHGGRQLIDVTVGNVKPVQRAMRALGEKELPKKLRTAGNEWAKIIAAQAKATAPRSGDTSKGAGQLWRTIRAASTRTQVRVRVGKVGGTPHAYIVQRPNGYRPRGGPTTVPGRPFLRESITWTWKEGIAAYQQALDELAAEFNRRYG